MKGLSKGRYDKTFAGEDALKTAFVNTDFNPYKPNVLFVGHRHTVQTQIIRCHRVRRLIRVSTGCLQNVLSFEHKWKIHQTTLKTEMDWSN